jgi:hypothetical protein
VHNDEVGGVAAGIISNLRSVQKEDDRRHFLHPLRNIRAQRVFTVARNKLASIVGLLHDFMPLLAHVYHPENHIAAWNELPKIPLEIL